MKILITGASGFIGFHTCLQLVYKGYDVYGIDNINSYYDPKLKFDRLNELGIQSKNISNNKKIKSAKFKNFTFSKIDIINRKVLLNLFKLEKFVYVIHLAAQAGVRYSLKNPDAYINSNIKGFLNILEAVRFFPVKHVIFASSSSVYGMNKSQPFSTDDSVNKPVSLYAVTKTSNELMAHSYSNLFDIPITGLRFFTVYGPWGRPDMAPMLFAKAMNENKPINVFNSGNLERDFTYIDDIVDGIIKILKHKPAKNKDGLKYKIFNIGSSNPIKLMDFINTLEESFNTSVQKIMLPMQDGDVYTTYADITDLKKITGYKPKTSLKEGIKKFTLWYKGYYS
tara:strand:- start:459 stop:1475 length:1017 start_codon:yes stop_codon:yes gene_type:complete